MNKVKGKMTQWFNKQITVSRVVILAGLAGYEAIKFVIAQLLRGL